jgi:hypothetical protein
MRSAVHISQRGLAVHAFVLFCVMFEKLHRRRQCKFGCGREEEKATCQPKVNKRPARELEAMSRDHTTHGPPIKIPELHISLFSSFATYWLEVFEISLLFTRLSLCLGFLIPFFGFLIPSVLAMKCDR